MKKLLYYFIFISTLLLCGCGSKLTTSEESIFNDVDTMNYKDVNPIELFPGSIDTISGGNQGSSGDIQGLPSSMDNTIPRPTTNISRIGAIQSNEGTLVYKIDSLLTIGVVSRVEAKIIKRVSTATTEYLVSITNRTSTGVIRTDIIKVGDIMDMNLLSLQNDAFIINKISSGDQPVDDNTVTEWLWGVTALKVGNYDLILKATIKEDGVNKDRIVFDKNITVQNRPKTKYTILIETPDKLKRFEESVIKLNFKEKVSDTYSFEWSGNGKVELEFNGKVNIKQFDNYDINDDKSLFNYKWVVEPYGNDSELEYTLKIVGDYEEIVLINNRVIVVDKNIKESFNRFIDVIAKRWYWLFTSLLIPMYSFFQRKYFPQRTIMFRKKKKTT